MAGQELDLGRLPTRERIIYAAMACLERNGIDGLTVRSISAEAGVNVAAVNYYFGSKDVLLEEMQKRQLASGFLDPLAELDVLLAIPGLPRDEALRQFFAGFIRDMSRYPRTVESYLHDGLVRQEYGGPAFVAFSSFLEGFLERTRDMLLPGDDLGQRTSVAQLWSAVLFLGMLPGATTPFLGESAVGESAVEAYAERVVSQYFPRA